MLDAFVIFNRGGMSVFSKIWHPLKAVTENETFGQFLDSSSQSSSVDPINKFIERVLIEGNVDENIQIDSYSMKYSLLNSQNLVFLAIHQKIIQVPYTLQFLEEAKKLFIKTQKSQEDFEPILLNLLRKIEVRKMAVNLYLNF